MSPFLQLTGLCFLTFIKVFLNGEFFLLEISHIRQNKNQEVYAYFKNLNFPSVQNYCGKPTQENVINAHGEFVYSMLWLIKPKI
jgi:hypothetical protein